MADEWPKAEVGDLAESISETHRFGKKELIFLNTSDVLRGKILHQSYSHVEHWPGQAKKSIRKGDILFSEIRPANGRYAYVDVEADDYVVSTKLMVIRARDRILPKFLFHYLTSTEITNWLQHLAESRSGTFPQITFDQVAELELNLPPKDAQKAIVSFIDALDDKIELNRRTNETLEAIAQALFKSCFVNFDPVHAKAEGRDPGLPKPLADLFPDSFEQSELGEIPKGWSVKAIGDVAERVAMGPFGSSIKVETFVPEGVPIISGQHLRGLMLEDSKFNFITHEHAKKLSNAIVQRGDIVFTHAGSIGQAAYIPAASRYERYVISQRQFYMRCDTLQVTPTFIAFYFNTHEGQHRLLANTSSSGVPSIARPVTYLRTIRLAIPPRRILDAFERIVSPILLQFRHNVEMNGTLATLRDALLPKLISGELRLKQSDRALKDRVVPRVLGGAMR